jgi:hypothetical protein
MRPRSKEFFPVSESRYTPQLNQMKQVLEQTLQVSSAAFDQVLEMAVAPAVVVFRPIEDVIAEGHEKELSEVSDLILIGAIVAQYGLVMPNPTMTKEE